MSQAEPVKRAKLMQYADQAGRMSSPDRITADSGLLIALRRHPENVL